MEADLSLSSKSSWAKLRIDFALEYGSYANMLTRCYNKNHEYRDCYGGKGITVCKDWLPRGKVGFIQFLSDMEKARRLHPRAKRLV
ncbi:hypothetical protein vB_PsyM_KIL3_0151 [Pseudomonas phage vB_PsyM_KIL3]|uniref:Uncharacterized protein n=1 Tax=Pseudomonas phage vB_PsyM_KIL3 TaxID=1777067 RepID=A0A142IER3_9CAUD|nr:hypothetical protein vB_PsyM_KIL3_0151 [Pseudomonas phage vB_PsyM_KIL3]